MDSFAKGSMWTIGRGSTLSFWHGNWTPKGPFRHLVHGPLSWEEEQLEVKDVVADLAWDWNWLHFDLPAEIKVMIQTIPVSITNQGWDKLIWNGNPRGSFDLKSAYSSTLDAESSSSVKCGWIWKVETLPRIKTFLWQCAHDSIGVKGCLVRRGVGGRWQMSCMPIRLKISSSCSQGLFEGQGCVESARGGGSESGILEL